MIIFLTVNGGVVDYRLCVIIRAKDNIPPADGPHLHEVGVAAGEAAAVGRGRRRGELRVRGQQRPLGRPVRVGLVLGAVLLVVLRLVALRHGGVARHRPGNDKESY